MTIVRSPVSSIVRSPISSVLGDASSGGGGGGSPGGGTALSLIQAAYQAGDFAAYWGIADELMYTAVSRDVTLPSSAGGTAIMPDKAAFSGDETVSEYVARLGLTGRADTVLPGFIGYQEQGTFEPNLIQAGLQPTQLENGNTDENLRIRASTGFSGSSAHTIVLALRSNDTDFVAGVSDSGTTRFAGRVRNSGSAADSNIGTPSYRVDGVDVVGTNANNLFATGISDFGWHVLTIEGMDLSTWNGDMIIGGFAIGASSLNMDGSLAYVAIFPDDTATRDLAEAEAADLVGITLP